jgi:hypothetical protein
MIDLYKLIYKNIKNNINNDKSRHYGFLESILRIIDIDINNLNKSDIINNVNIFRRKLGNELIQNNLYKILPNKLRFSKNSIHLKLINNELCDENIYKYISYYLELNIIIINNNVYRCVNPYDNMINSIILVENEITRFIPIYVLYNGVVCNIFDDILIKKLLENFKLNDKIIFNNKSTITEDELKKINKFKNYKLQELQDLCKIYNINIYSNSNSNSNSKQNKINNENNIQYKTEILNENKKYKKKQELFEELKNKLINDIKLI